MKKIGLVLLFLVMSCNRQTVSDRSVSTGNFSLKGVAQKGPFAIGSSVTIQELDNSLTPTGKVYVTTTSDDLGHFSVKDSVSSRFVEVIMSGYYFDEVLNTITSSPLTFKLSIGS